MFNLEQSIAEWRRQMLAAGIHSPVPLTELESHLRDEVEQRAGSGLSEEAAFQLAVQGMGGASALKGEFAKNQSSKRNHLLKTILVLAALGGSVLGGAMVLPALGRWNHAGVLVLQPLIAGGTLALLAGGAALYGVSRHRGPRGRRLIRAGIVGAGGFYIVPLVQAFFIPNVDLMEWSFCVLLAVASPGFYGVCFHLHGKDRGKRV